MSGPSVLNNVDSTILSPLSKDSHDSVYIATGIENGAEALGLLNQLSEITRACEHLFKGISDRLYNVNKRIRAAETSITEFEKKIVSKQDELYANDLKTKMEEVTKPLSVAAVSEFDYFSLPKPKSRRPVTKPMPDLSKLLSSDKGNAIYEFTSSVKKNPIEIKRRADEPKHSSPHQPDSIYSTITKKFILNHDIRMTATMKEKMAFGYSDDSLNASTASMPPITTHIKPHIPQPTAVKTRKPTQRYSPPPPPIDIKPRSPPLADTKPLSPPPIDTKPLSPPPTDTKPRSPAPMLKPPPPSSQPPIEAGSSEDYHPPLDFLAEIRKKASEIPPPQVETPRPLPSSFLEEIRKKGTERRAGIASRMELTTQEPSSPVQMTEPPPFITPKPHPPSFLEEIRKKGTERQAAVLSNPPPSEATPTEATPTPSRPLPLDFLAEIRKKGTERQEAAAKKAQQNPASPTKSTLEMRSRQSTLSSRNGTIRSGTLGGDSRASCRYGTGILNDLRGLDRNTFFAQENDEPTPQTPKPSGNPFLDEIRNFDMKKLRKVTPQDQSSSNSPINNPISNESSMADMLRERLRIMQSDSSDESDSTSDFSDYYCFLKKALKGIDYRCFDAGLSLAGAGCGLQIRRGVTAQQFDSA